MAVVEAGDYYLAAECPANAAIRDLLDQLSAIDFAVPGPSPKEVKSAATTAAEILQMSAAQLDDPPLGWPADVNKEVPKVVKSFLRDMQVFQVMARATTTDRLSEAIMSWDYERGKTAIELVRLRLELPRYNTKKNGCP